mgnify:CR=1 FL=1
MIIFLHKSTAYEEDLLKEKLISIYKKKQGRFAGKIPAVQGIFHTERQGSPNLQKQEKSNEKRKKFSYGNPVHL